MFISTHDVISLAFNGAFDISIISGVFIDHVKAKLARCYSRKMSKVIDK
jgi:hypothetical protein